MCIRDSTIAVGVLMLIINMVKSRKNICTELDPWDARTLEWMTTSPPQAHNFDSTPQIHTLDEFFYRKYEENEHGELVKVRDAQQVLDEMGRDEHIHMPSPSYWPLVLAFGIPFLSCGVIFKNIYLCLLGGALIVGAVYAWAMEDATEPEGPGHGGDAADHGELATVG